MYFVYFMYVCEVVLRFLHIVFKAFIYTIFFPKPYFAVFNYTTLYTQVWLFGTSVHTDICTHLDIKMILMSFTFYFYMHTFSTFSRVCSIQHDIGTSNNKGVQWMYNTATFLVTGCCLEVLYCNVAWKKHIKDAWEGKQLFTYIRMYVHL